MSSSNGIKEWLSTDCLPKGFAEWLKDIVLEEEANKGFRKTAEELGVPPSILRRWLGGKGPLHQHDIDLLASKLGLVVYTFLGFPRPDYT